MIILRIYSIIKSQIHHFKTSLWIIFSRGEIGIVFLLKLIARGLFLFFVFSELFYFLYSHIWVVCGTKYESSLHQSNIRYYNGYNYQYKASGCNDDIIELSRSDRLAAGPIPDRTSPQFSFYYNPKYDSTEFSICDPTPLFESYISILSSIRELDNNNNTINEYKLNSWKRITNKNRYGDKKLCKEINYTYSATIYHLNHPTVITIKFNWFNEHCILGETSLLSSNQLSNNFNISISSYHFESPTNHLQLVSSFNISKVGKFKIENSAVYRFISYLSSPHHLDDRLPYFMSIITGNVLDESNQTIYDFASLYRDEHYMHAIFPKEAVIDNQTSIIQNQFYPYIEKQPEYYAEGGYQTIVLSSSEIHTNIPNFRESIEISNIRFMLLHHYENRVSQWRGCKYQYFAEFLRSEKFPFVILLIAGTIILYPVLEIIKRLTVD